MLAPVVKSLSSDSKGFVPIWTDTRIEFGNYDARKRSGAEWNKTAPANADPKGRAGGREQRREAGENST